MKILIAAPFFNNLGGSELETIHTANTIAEESSVRGIVLFVHYDLDKKFTSGIYLHPKIIFKTYPFWFKNKGVVRLQKELKAIFNLDVMPFEFLFWKLFFLKKISGVYIITKSSQNYYIPIIRSFVQKSKIIIKYTTVFFEEMPLKKKELLNQCSFNFVTSHKQELFFENELKIPNTVVQEVLIYNEEYALKQKKERIGSNYDFGILGRFSEEKQFEDAIDVIINLRNMGNRATLIIRGDGDRAYYDFLLDKVEKNQLSNDVFLDFTPVQYDNVYDFFKEFNCFLITSKYEGGPNVALEIMAYGMPLLTYRVGAMEDRLINFPSLIANDIADMTIKALNILKLENLDYLNLAVALKKEYQIKFANEKKIRFLRQTLLKSTNI